MKLKFGARGGEPPGLLQAPLGPTPLGALVTALVVVLTLPCFLPQLFENQQVPVDGNSLRLFRANWEIGQSLLRDGVFGLWESVRNMGQPYLADPQNQAFYLSRFLFLGTSYENFLRVGLFFHLALLAYFGHRLGEQWVPKGGFFLGVLFALNGFVLNKVSNPVYLATLAWVPALLYFHRIKRPVLGAVCVALQWFGGYPPYFVLTFLLVILSGLASPGRREFLIVAAKQYVIGLGFSAVQWIPFLEMLMDSNRPVLLSAANAFQYSQPPWELLKALLLPADVFYAHGSPGKMDPAVGSFFLGPVLTVLFVLGAWRGRREQKFIAGLALLGFCFSLGPSNGFYQHLPLATLFRFPSHWLLMAVVCYLLTALVGWSGFRSRGVKWGLLALVLFDFGRFAIVPRVYWFNARWVQERVATSWARGTPKGTRLFHPADIPRELHRWGIHAPSEWAALLTIALPSTAAGSGISEVESFSVLTARRSTEFQKRLNAVPFQDTLFDIANVGAAIALPPGSSRERVPPATDFVFLLNPDLRGRAFLREGKKATVLRDVGGAFDCQAEGPGLLVFSETYHRGWKVTVGDQKALPQPFEGTFLSVSLPEGVQTVKFRFRPNSFLWGVGVAGGTLMGLCVGAISLFRRRRRLLNA